MPWWGGQAVTLHHVLVHVIADTQRHAGHADIVRELIDGSAGLLPHHDNLPSRDADWWAVHRQRSRPLHWTRAGVEPLRQRTADILAVYQSMNWMTPSSSTGEYGPGR